MRVQVALFAVLSIGSLCESDALAACDTTVSALDLYAALSDAQRAFAELDIDAFLAADQRAHTGLPCVAEPMSRRLAAEFHRTSALAAAMQKDPDGARVAFSAAKTIEPDYAFPRETLPENSPARAAYDAAPIVTSTTTVPAPWSGSLSFDGRAGLDRPVGVPTIVQVMDADGRVTTTLLIAPDVVMPWYATSAPEASPRARTPLIVGTAAAGALTALAVVVGTSAGGAYADLDTPDAKLPALRQTANASAIAAGVAGAATLGLGVTLVVRW